MAFVPAYTDPSPELLATALAFTGPVLASVVVYNFLYGIAVAKAFDYLQWYQDDPLILRILVLWEMAMATIHYILMCDQLWGKTIIGWGVEAILYDSSVSGNLLNVTTLFLLVPAQCFYLSLAFRALNKNYYFLAGMGAGVALVAGSGITLCVQLVFMGQSFGTLTLLPNIYLWSALAVDICIAGVLCARFRSLQKGAGDVSRNVLWSFMALSIRTSAFTTSVALVERLAHATGHGLIAQAPGLILAGVIVLSLLHTLNSRKELQQRLEGTESGPTTGALSRRFGRNNNNRTEVNPRSEIRVDTIVLEKIERVKDGDGIEKVYKEGYSRNTPFQSAGPTVNFAENNV